MPEQENALIFKSFQSHLSIHDCKYKECVDEGKDLPGKKNVFK